MGGYAWTVHQEPRYTKDLDVWIEAVLANAEALQDDRPEDDWHARHCDTSLAGETGGSLLFQSQQHHNGTPLPAPAGLPGLDQIGAGTPSGGGLVIQLDGSATTTVLQGQAVQTITNNPRLVPECDYVLIRNRTRTVARSRAFS